MSAHIRRPIPGPAQKPPRPFSVVETATSGDLTDLIYFLRSVREEIGGGLVEDILMIELAESLASRQGGIAFVVKGQHGIEGSFGIRFDRPWYTKKFRLVSTWNVVEPSLRAVTGHAKSLQMAARNFADQLGRPLYLEELTPMGIDMKKADDPKLRLCGRVFRPAGMLFEHVPESSAA